MKFLLFNIRIFIDYLSLFCYVIKVINLYIITRISSVIWSECLYLVPIERTGLRVKVLGCSAFLALARSVYFAGFSIL